MKTQAIITAPPYVSFLEEAARHPFVHGLRLNTVMPLKESHTEVLQRMSALGPPLWIDLKYRQLRVAQAAIPPFTAIELSHEIQVDTPVDAYFSDGKEHARIVGVEGNKIILENGPRRLVGPGESVNIPHASLKIKGGLTETDMAYLEAMRKLGMRNVMLSYVETIEDVAEVKTYLPDAEIVLKIETQKGLDFIQQHKNTHGRLMAARGDLFVEVGQPHRIVNALKQIIQADPDAIVASRLFDNLAYHPVPTQADISDAAFLLEIGYRTFMFGDQICFDRDSVLEALNILEAIGDGYK